MQSVVPHYLTKQVLPTWCRLRADLSKVQVEMSRKVKLVADKLISDLRDQQFDLIALPGRWLMRNFHNEDSSPESTYRQLQRCPL